MLTRLPHGCRLLDVGIGTGRALLANTDLVVAKDSARDRRRHRRRLRRALQSPRWRRTGLGDRIAARHESIYDHRGGPYDAAYFSASFMLLPDPPAALRHVRALLAPAAASTSPRPSSTTVRAPSSGSSRCLRLVTTIDFGRVTYESDFRRALAGGGVEIEKLEVLHGGPRRSAVLAVAHGAAAGTGRAVG